MWSNTVAIGAVLLVLLASAQLGTSEAAALNYTSLIEWMPPKGWDKQFPYYIAGFDKGGRPVAIWEFGKFDIRSTTSKGATEAANIEAYLIQLHQNIIALGRDFESEGGFTLITDFEGFNHVTLVHLTSALTLLRAAKYTPELGRLIHSGFGINVNYATERLFSFLGQALSNVLANSEILGTNKERWLPKLLAEIPKSQLPPWYGGSKDWKPLQILGRGVPVDLELVRREKARFDAENGGAAEA